jgi:hypothetical protein
MDRRVLFAQIEMAPTRIAGEALELIEELAEEVQDVAAELIEERPGHLVRHRADAYKPSAAESLDVRHGRGRNVKGQFRSAFEVRVGYDTSIAPHGPPIETGTGIYGPNRRPYLSHTPNGKAFMHPGMEAIRPLGEAVELTAIPREVQVRKFAEGLRVAY